MADGEDRPIEEPRESLFKVFRRFLRFGLLAWGGPVAQIAMIRQELVEEERWVTPERFNRVLAVYQVLPGPEAHELCVYFGMLAHGRIGAFLAGLGFMLPGFALMFFLSWLYVTYGTGAAWMASLLYGCQPAVAALVVRAVHRIGGHALHDRWLWFIAVAAGIMHWVGAPFVLTLAFAGLAYWALKESFTVPPMAGGLLLFLPVVLLEAPFSVPSLNLFGYGLRSGLLTFGGAYTVIPFLQNDAVVVGGWMTTGQFLDGLALSSILPAPLIIFATFVGYLGGGPLGAIALTAGIFLPAFAFTMIGHSFFERLVEKKSIHAILDGVTAGVVGLIAVTAIELVKNGVGDFLTAAIFVTGLVLLFRWKSRFAIPVLVIGAGCVGWVLRMVGVA